MAIRRRVRDPDPCECLSFRNLRVVRVRHSRLEKLFGGDGDLDVAASLKPSHDLLGQLDVAFSTARFWIMHERWFSVARGLGEPNVARNRGLEKSVFEE